MTFEIGESVGPYRVTDRLGQGGMATVYRAYHANLDRYVAIKVLHAAFKEAPNFLARFQREAQIVAKLEHPSIVPIYDYSDHKGEPYLVMKFIEGDTLKARLSRKPLTLEETLSAMTAVAQALTYAHEQGVLHRDIKPSNILLEKNTTPYIADFGLARIASAGESTLSQDSMLGTPQYMSPEQAQGVKDLSPAADIYSLGVVLYELVVGRVPFNADTPYAIVHDHIYSPLPMPTKVNPQVPQSVERVLLKTLSKDRNDRYQSAVEMVEAFRTAVRESDLKELSASSFRVPTQDPPTYTPYTPPNVPGMSGTQTPMPAVGIPTPMQSLNTPSPYAQAYAKRTRRRNLWMLFGFSLLVLTCLAGMFISLSTYTAANNAGLFIPAPALGASANPTEVTVLETAIGTQDAAADIVATSAAIEPVTTAEAAASISTSEPTAKPTATLTLLPEATPTPIDPTQPFPLLTIAEAEILAKTYPGDVRAHLAFSIALSRGNRNPRAQAEFATAFRLLNGDAALAMELGKSMLMRPVLNSTFFPAMIFATAYSFSADTDPTVRAEAGQALYNYTSKIDNRREALSVRALADLVDGMKSSPTNLAGLYSFIALALHNAGEDRLSKVALDKATALSEHLPEVLLVKGIIEQNQNDNVGAQVDLQAATNASGAPQWLIDEAKRLAQKGS